MKSTCTYPCYRTNKEPSSKGRKKRKSLKLVCFDMDGVLLDTVSSWRYIHEYFGTTNERSILPYLRGDIDYLEFIRRDVSLWKTNGTAVSKATIEKILWSIISRQKSVVALTKIKLKIRGSIVSSTIL